jgi:hypothetical protein
MMDNRALIKHLNDLDGDSFTISEARSALSIIEDQERQLTTLKEQLAESEKRRILAVQSALTEKQGLEAQLAEREEKFSYYSKLHTEEHETLQAKNAALSKRNGELVEGLRKLEWLHSKASPEEIMNHCPICTAWHGEHHKPDCWLSKLLTEQKEG